MDGGVHEQKETNPRSGYLLSIKLSGPSQVWEALPLLNFSCVGPDQIIDLHRAIGVANARGPNINHGTYS